jgi:cytidylate kinase
VLASRLAIWMWKDAKLKVYLDAPLEVRAGRVFERERHHFPDLEAALRHTSDRDEMDHRRYREIYGIDNDDWAFADLVIDVSSITPFEIVNKIIRHLGLDV